MKGCLDDSVPGCSSIKVLVATLLESSPNHVPGGAFAYSWLGGEKEGPGHPRRPQFPKVRVVAPRERVSGRDPRSTGGHVGKWSGPDIMLWVSGHSLLETFEVGLPFLDTCDHVKDSG